MRCGCITKINDQLKPWGSELKTTIVMVETEHSNALLTTLTLPLAGVDGRKLKKDDPQKIHCRYCPFCGEKIDLKKEAEDLHAEAERKKTESVNG